MPVNVWTRWLPRVVFAAFAGAVPAITTLAPSLDEAPHHELQIELAASTGGTLQVYVDRGTGFSEAGSTSVPFDASGTPVVLRVVLPVGTYYHFRIDPNHRPGRYLFRQLRVVDRAGLVTNTFPLEAIRPLDQVTLEREADGLAVVTTEDAADPQILYSPQTPLTLGPPDPDLPTAIRRAGITGLVTLLIVVLLDRLSVFAVVLGRAGALIARRPLASVVAAAIAGTLLATYPLLLGRSLVSPGNGPVFLLYDQPPFVPGATDRQGENARGVDVGATMWAILPYTVVQREALAHGELPLWNRYNAIGEPLWGQGQTFVLDPFHLASLAIPDPAVAMDLRFIVGRAVFAIGSGLTVAVATGNGVAAVIVALLAPFVGHFTARFNHPAFFSIVYAPWILLAYARLAGVSAAGARLRAGALIAIASFLQLVGSTPKEGVIALVAAHVAGLTGLLVAPGVGPVRLGRLGAAVLGGVVAVLLAAPHWLIFLGTLSRAETLYDTPSVQLAGWSHLIGWAIGATAPDTPLAGANALVLMAAACALCYPGRLRSSTIGPGAVLVVAGCAAIALGAVPSGVLMRIPLLGNVHNISGVFLGATVAPLLVVAGVGLAAALAEVREGWPLRLVTGVVVSAIVLAWLVGRSFHMATILSAAAVFGAAAALLMLPTCRRTRRPSALLAALGGAAAAVFAGGLHLDTGLAAVDTALIQPRPRADLDEPSPALRALPPADGHPYRVAPVDAVLFPGTQALWKVEAIGGPDALRLPAIEAFLDAAGMERTDWVWRTVLRPDAVDRLGPALDMLNVRYLVARANQVPPGARVLPTNAPDLIRIVERSGAWPRAFFTEGVGRHRGVTDFADRLRISAGPFSSVDEQDVSAIEAVRTLPRTGAVTPATRYMLTPNSTSFHVETAHSGIAVLAEAFVEKDFQATLNGRNVAYFRVNHAFKGVLIPGPGSWHVVFEYRPDRWRLSWLLNALGMTGLALMVLAAPLLKSSASRQ